MLKKLLEVTVDMLVGERFENPWDVTIAMNNTLLFKELGLEVELTMRSDAEITEEQDDLLVMTVINRNNKWFYADFDLWYLTDNTDNFYITETNLTEFEEGKLTKERKEWIKNNC